jgi:hypothetical protein
MTEGCDEGCWRLERGDEKSDRLLLDWLVRSWLALGGGVVVRANTKNSMDDKEDLELIHPSRTTRDAGMPFNPDREAPRRKVQRERHIDPVAGRGIYSMRRFKV